MIKDQPKIRMFLWSYLFPCLSSWEPSISRGVRLVGTKSQLFPKIQNGGSPESFPTRRLFLPEQCTLSKNQVDQKITIIALLIHDRHQTMLNPPKISEKPPKENRALPIEQVFTLQISYNGRVYSNIVFNYYIM